MSNQAAWITAAKAYPLEVKESPMPKAGAGEVVIKNHAVAINPVDSRRNEPLTTAGVVVKKYPNVIGTDVAGEVYEVGSGVIHVKKGDRVLGYVHLLHPLPSFPCILLQLTFQPRSHAFSLITGNPTNGGFNLYTLCNSLAVSPIPTSLSYSSAAVLPLSISTASACLYKHETLSLPLPSTSSKSTNKSVLIWGGSSSVGASAIQLAAASGVTVVSVASKHNLGKLKELGAKQCWLEANEAESTPGFSFTLHRK
ncbi:GroES-like protein [Periconia macrospinosa]|uniref:GroES-like protein n=1 Tax=Periconia macrospinosa TaxID=97972 RepID=A0A2V1D7P6_9PLEO|nr:GroES-like protein [Periconia macrospinosa]